MIHELIERAKNTGFSITELLSDHDGVYGLRLAYGSKSFRLVAKEYAYRNNASFMRTVVDDARENDELLIFYNGEDDESTVFCPHVVYNVGSISYGASKKRDVEWIELPLIHGVGLHDYMNDGADPTMTTPSGYKSLSEF